MKKQPLEVKNTLAQTERVYEGLRAAGVAAEMVCNPDQEPLAVVARGLFDPNKILGSPALGQLWQTETYDYDTISTLGDVLPISGPKLYSPDFLKTLDVIVQSAAGSQGVLATRLRANRRDDTDFTLLGKGLGLHADFVGASLYRDKSLQIDGLNIHATRWGTAVAKLGVLRTLDERDLQAARAMDEPTGKRIHQNEAYTRLASPFTEPVVLNAGDVLVFQAQQRTEKHMAGVAHDFATISETRRSDVMVPHAGDVVTVLAQRHTLIQQLQLNELGY